MNIKKISFFFSFLFIVFPAHASEITVSAATSLTDVFSDLRQGFMDKNPEILVYINFASSNTLLKQIEEGAPVDVFVSADQITMAQAEKSQLIDSNTRKDFALNTLVLVVPFDAKNIPSNMSELRDEKYKKIAIGNTGSSPVGRYAKESLASANLWDILENRFIYAENTRQVLDYVARGEVDAGLVYATDAMAQKGKVKIAFTMQGHQSILYPLALIRNSKNKKIAQDFLGFIFSDEARIILTEHGFIRP